MTSPAPRSPTLSNGVTYNYEIRERTGRQRRPNQLRRRVATGSATSGQPDLQPAVNATNVTITWTGDTNADAIVFRTPTGANTS
ncbi:MAG: hypothetical protein R2706_03575 [Acidimicrobiales bacterium]